MGPCYGQVYNLYGDPNYGGVLKVVYDGVCWVPT